VDLDLRLALPYGAVPGTGAPSALFHEPVWTWVALVQPFGTYAGFAMAAGLAGLWARRFLVPPHQVHIDAVGPI